MMSDKEVSDREIKELEKLRRQFDELEKQRKQWFKSMYAHRKKAKKQ